MSIDFINKYITWDDNQYSRSDPPNKCLEMESFEEIKLLQYTGLKDKNGIEIYEGDILICHEYDSSDCGKRIVQTFNNAVVGFSDGNYYYFPKGNMKMPHQLLMDAYNPLIIGNIYENPELLIP